MYTYTQVKNHVFCCIHGLFHERLKDRIFTQLLGRRMVFGVAFCVFEMTALAAAVTTATVVSPVL